MRDNPPQCRTRDAEPVPWVAQDKPVKGPAEGGNYMRAKRWGLGRKRNGAGRSGVAGAPASEGRAGFIGVLRRDDRSGEKRKSYRTSAAEAPYRPWALRLHQSQRSRAPHGCTGPSLGFSLAGVKENISCVGRGSPPQGARAAVEGCPASGVRPLRLIFAQEAAIVWRRDETPRRRAGGGL